MYIVASIETTEETTVSNMILQVEFLAGTDITTAAIEAKALACKLDLAYVKFNFNGVKVSVGQCADVDKVEGKLHEAFQQEHKHFIENGRD